MSPSACVPTKNFYRLARDASDPILLALPSDALVWLVIAPVASALADKEPLAGLAAAIAFAISPCIYHVIARWSSKLWQS